MATLSTTFSTSLSTTSSQSATPTPGSPLASADESKESNEPSNVGGISNDVKVGLIAGGSVAGILLCGFLLYICVRKRQQKESGGDLDISEPLPGSGREYAAEPKKFEPIYISEPKNFESTFPTTYSPQRPSPPTSSGSHGARGSYESELDREARRYEDMMPSAQPRMMI